MVTEGPSRLGYNQADGRGKMRVLTWELSKEWAASGSGPCTVMARAGLTLTKNHRLRTEGYIKERQ